MTDRVESNHTMWWFEQPLPCRWHRCKTATSGSPDGRLVERCACGAIRIDRGRWMERNTRKRK